MDIDKFTRQCMQIEALSDNPNVAIANYVARHFKELNDELALNRPPHTRALVLHLLGNVYKFGADGFPIDIPKAIKLYEESVELGNKNALQNLGFLHRDSGNFEKAFEYFMATKNWYEAGKCYDKGEGVMQSYEKAFEMFSKVAADRSNKAYKSEALHYIGVYYFNGEGVVKNATKAFQHFEEAANLGYVGSYYNVARLLYDGNGCKVNKKAALGWCKKAVSKGDPKAIELLKEMELDAHKARLDIIRKKQNPESSADAGGAAGGAPDATPSAGGGAAPEVAPSKKRKAQDVPASVAFGAPAVDSISSKAIKKPKAAALSPEQKSTNVQKSIAERKAAKAASGAAAVVERPVIQRTFPERTASHYHDADLLESICFCAIEKSPPTLTEAVDLLAMLGFVEEHSSDGHSFWSKNKHDPTVALPVFDDIHSGRIKFSKSDKASGMYPIHYGQLWKLLGLIDFDGTALKCPICKK